MEKPLTAFGPKSAFHKRDRSGRTRSEVRAWVERAAKAAFIEVRHANQTPPARIPAA